MWVLLTTTTTYATWALMATPTTPLCNALSLTLPQSTPVKTGTSSLLPFTMTQKYCVESHTALAKEVKKHLVGPMPPKEFLETFFPLDKISQETEAEVFKVGCYKDTMQAIKERLAYGPFVSPLNGYPQPALTVRLNFRIKTTETFMPGFSAINSSNYPDCHQSSKFPFKLKPNISVYASCKPSYLTKSVSVEIFIKFKWNNTNDPFCDNTWETFTCPSKNANNTLGQITFYAALHLAAQFRTHVYSILIVRRLARILHWDRSGTIMMEAFKYDQCPHLAKFFCQYSRVLDNMRGKDGTVSMPTYTLWALLINQMFHSTNLLSFA